MVSSPIKLPRLLGSALLVDKDGKPSRELTRYWDEHCTLLEDAINGLISIESQVSGALNATSELQMRLGSLEPTVGQVVADLSRLITDMTVMFPPSQSGAAGVSGIAALTSAHIFVGNASNFATDVAMSGDATIANTGALTIANDAVTFAKFQNIADNRLLGRSAGSSGDMQELTVGTGLSLSGGSLTATGGGTGGAGSLYPSFTAPVDGDFAWINQGSASVTVNANGGIHLICPASATDSLRVRKKSAPATPYTITAAFFYSLRLLDFMQIGLLWRQSSDGKLITFNLAAGNTFPGDIQLTCFDWTNATTFAATNVDIDLWHNGLMFLRIADDGTNRTVSWSVDGYNFETALTEGRTTFLTADEVGFFANSSTATAGPRCTLMSWQQT